MDTVSRLRKNGKQRSILYWMVNYQPQWEASSKELHVLLTEMEKHYSTHLLSLNFGREPASRFLGKKKRLPLPLFLPLILAAGFISRRYSVNHLFASPSERHISTRLIKENSILTITKDSPSLALIERNVQNLKKFSYIVVESERHRDILEQVGIKQESIKLIYPGFDCKPHVAPQRKSFTFLFASAPIGANKFIARGINLVISVAKRLPDVRFVFVWRKSEYDKLLALIESAGVKNIEILNGHIPDMGALYDSVHAVIMPTLEAQSCKPSPHSALESLAHGKPILVSSVNSLVAIVKKYNCGAVFEPTIESLAKSIQMFMDNYAVYQAQSHRVIKEEFSREIFIEQYRKLYEQVAYAPMNGMIGAG